MESNTMKTKENNKRLMHETFLVIMITILLFITFNKYKSVITWIPAVYFFIERRIRRRSWNEVGFMFKNVLKDLKNNWHWLLLAGVISQPLTFIIGKYFVKGFVEHVVERVPMDFSLLIPAIIIMACGTFLEEIIFRGFIQERLSWFWGVPLSIIVTSLLFALAHYSIGSFNIVAFDLITIFIDSILFGIIFAKTKNIYTTWIGHLVGNLMGLFFFLFFV